MLSDLVSEQLDSTEPFISVTSPELLSDSHGNPTSHGNTTAFKSCFSIRSLRRIIVVGHADSLYGNTFLLNRLERERQFLEFTMARMAQTSPSEPFERTREKPMVVQVEWNSTIYASPVQHLPLTLATY